MIRRYALQHITAFMLCQFRQRRYPHTQGRMISAGNRSRVSGWIADRGVRPRVYRVGQAWRQWDGSCTPTRHRPQPRGGNMDPIG